jgi:hypothetical protein
MALDYNYPYSSPSTQEFGDAILGAITTPAGSEAIAASLIPLPDAPLAEVKQRLDVMLASDLTLERFGAVGDGLSHPVSELYPTLPAARAAYPDYLTHKFTVPYASGSSSTIDLPYNADPDEHGGFSGGRYKLALTGGTGAGQTLDITSAATAVISTTTITAGSGVNFTLASGANVQVGMLLDATMNGVRQVRRVATINTATGVGTVSNAWFSVVVGSTVRVVRFVATMAAVWTTPPDLTTTVSMSRQVVLADERDWAATQYVTNRLDPTGGFVTLKPGAIYVINESVWRVSFAAQGISKAGIYFQGPGYNGATFLSSCINVPMFRIIGCRVTATSFFRGGGFSGCMFDGTPGSGAGQHALYTQGILNFTLSDFLWNFFDGDGVHDVGDTSISTNPDFTSGGNWSVIKGTIQRIGGAGISSEIPIGFYGCDFTQVILVFTGKSGFYINASSHRFTGCSIIGSGFLSETVINDDGKNYYGIDFRSLTGTVVRLAISDCEIQQNKTGHLAINGLSTVDIIRTRFIWDPAPAIGGGTYLAPTYGIRLADGGATQTAKKLTMRRCVARIDAVGSPILCQFDGTAGVADIEIREWEVQNAPAAIVTPFAGYTAANSHLNLNYRLSTAARMYAAGRPQVHQMLTLAATPVLQTPSFANVPFETLDGTTAFPYPIKQGMTFTTTIPGGVLTTLVVNNQGRGMLVPNQTALPMTIVGDGTGATATCDTDPQGFPVNPVITAGGSGYTTLTASLDVAGLWDNVNHRYVCHEDGLYWLTFGIVVNAQSASDWCRVALYKATTIGGTPAVVTGTERGGIGMATPMNRFRWDLPPRLIWMKRGETYEVQATCTNSRTIQTGESFFQVIRHTENPL